MKSGSAALLLLLLSVSSCNKDDGRSSPRPQAPVGQEPITSPEIKAPTSKAEEESSAEAKSEEFILQVTGLNFLPGGLEQCGARNKLYRVNLQDENVKHVVCRNSRTELSFISDGGVITYEAIDLLSGAALPPQDSGTDQSYDLSSSQGMQRFYPQNPHGFTYLMVEDVTGISEEGLEELNKVNNRYSRLKARELDLIQRGKRIPDSLSKELEETNEEMERLREKYIK